MPKFDFDFDICGTITVEAATREEARKFVESLSVQHLSDNSDDVAININDWVRGDE